MSKRAFRQFISYLDQKAVCVMQTAYLVILLLHHPLHEAAAFRLAAQFQQAAVN